MTKTTIGAGTSCPVRVTRIVLISGLTGDIFGYIGPRGRA